MLDFFYNNRRYLTEFAESKININGKIYFYNIIVEEDEIREVH